MKKMYRSAYLDIVVSAIVILAAVGYFIYQSYFQQQMIELYILDKNKKAINYPHTIIVGVNNSIVFYIGIENKLWNDACVSIKIKLTNSSHNFDQHYIFSKDYFLKSSESTLDLYKVNITDIALINGKFWITSVYVNGKKAFLDLRIEKGGILNIIVELWHDNNFSGQWVELKIKMED